MTFLADVFIYKSTMTVGTTEYSLDKATWADKTAWLNDVVWLYEEHESTNTSPEASERCWNRLWHQSLVAKWPMEVGDNRRTFTAFRVDGVIAGFFTGFYHKESETRTVGQASSIRCVMLNAFKGQGHFKYMWALVTALLKDWGSDVMVEQYHAATGLRKALSENSGVTHTGTTAVPWDDTGTIFRQNWEINAAAASAAVEGDARFPAITVTSGYLPLSHANWSSPVIQEFLAPATTSGPSPSEGF